MVRCLPLATPCKVMKHVMMNMQNLLFQRIKKELDAQRENRERHQSAKSHSMTDDTP